MWYGCRSSCSFSVPSSRGAYDFETILVNQADAEKYGLERYRLSYTPQAELTINGLAPFDFDFMDNIDFHFVMHGRERLPNSRWRVINMNKIRHTATLKFIEVET